MQPEFSVLKKELESVHRQCDRLLDINKELEEKQRALEKRITAETVARAQADFGYKLKIETLTAENSRLKLALERELIAKDGRQQSGLTFAQKKRLSERIAKLRGQRLEEIITMIHREMPQIKDAEGEVEVEIDQLSERFLTELYDFVFDLHMKLTSDSLK
ncbi:hypothetical protein C8R47DRAFT_1214071 [Mycena vitilis]|nr:hypothetical protein C8R47DRAFT_1231284 [Mycena vitilis]KAJ6492760.1 hypothetical protein C8R47DRAFT_1214071 [Mycena vitilis]